MKDYFLLILCIGVCFSSCNKNDDAPIIEEEQEIIEPPEEVNIEVQNFMWQTMNTYYFWQGDVIDLADDRFATQVAYEDFLTETPDPETFLTNKLLFSEDRFTFYREDYRDLTNLLSGVFKSNGLEFGLSRIGDSDDVYGFVEYIIKDSDASVKNIKRGDIFIGVNGTRLNANNFRGLLFGDEDTYTLNMGTIENNIISPSGEEVTLTKRENLQEDPILVNTVLNIGDKRIGYLMYNSFLPGSGEDLNNVFSTFRGENITDLVLDLRYNSGGSGLAATILAGLIYAPNTDELFYRTRYNAKLEEAFGSNTDNNFVGTTGTRNGSTDAVLNSLNLDKVYILATNASASASELVMVGLEPYLDVVHIGSRTTGKNQGSLTFVDDPENGNVYDRDREDNINPNVQWGLQPIISFVENSVGFSDYSDGLIPDIELDEDVTDLGILGNPNEPLLARAIQEITGTSAKRSFEVNIPSNIISSSKLFDERRSVLILDNIKGAEIKSIAPKE